MIIFEIINEFKQWIFSLKETSGSNTSELTEQFHNSLSLTKKAPQIIKISSLLEEALTVLNSIKMESAISIDALNAAIQAYFIGEALQNVLSSASNSNYEKINEYRKKIFNYFLSVDATDIVSTLRNLSQNDDQNIINVKSFLTEILLVRVYNTLVKNTNYQQTTDEISQIENQLVKLQKEKFRFQTPTDYSEPLIPGSLKRSRLESASSETDSTLQLALETTEENIRTTKENYSNHIDSRDAIIKNIITHLISNPSEISSIEFAIYEELLKTDNISSIESILQDTLYHITNAPPPSPSSPTP